MAGTAHATNYKAALTEAFAAAAVASPERSIGCCRVYVVILGAGFTHFAPVSRSEKAAISKEIGAAAKAIGKIFQAKAHYGLTNALYVGYDNCDGKALAQGAAIVASLKAAGIACYREECAD